MSVYRRGDIVRAPLGRYHDPERCAYCGSRGRLRDVLIVETHAWGRVCVNEVRCLRRQREFRAAA